MADGPLSKRLSKADVETLREIMREAEAYLNAQWAAAIGADQRAYTFAGFCSAAAVVLIGGSYSLAASEAPDFAMALLAAFVAAYMLRAAWEAARSAAPVDFDYVGNRPGHWIEDIEAGIDLCSALAHQCQHYDEMIADNAAVIRANAAAFKSANKTALIGIEIGAIGFAGWLIWQFVSYLR